MMSDNKDDRTVCSLPPPMRAMMRRFGVSDDMDWLTAIPLVRAAIKKCENCPYADDCLGRASTYQRHCPNAEIFKMLREFGGQH